MTDVKQVTPTVALEGIETLKRRLDALPGQLQRKLIRKTLRAAARPLLEQARANAPVSEATRHRGKRHKPGMLRKSIKIRVAKRNRKFPDRAAIRVSSAAKDNLFSGETFYGGFVELGTENQPPQGFLTRAVAQAAPRVFAVFGAETSSAVDEAVRELAGAISSGGRV